MIRFDKFCLKFCQFRFWKICHFCVTNLKKIWIFTSVGTIVSGQLDTSSLHQIFFQILLIDVKEWIQMYHKSRLDKKSKRKVNLLSPWKCQFFHLTLPVTETERECFAPLYMYEISIIWILFWLDLTNFTLIFVNLDFRKFVIIVSLI